MTGLIIVTGLVIIPTFEVSVRRVVRGVTLAPLAPWVILPAGFATDIFHETRPTPGLEGRVCSQNGLVGSLHRR